MQKIWQIKEANPHLSDDLAHSLNISKIAAQLLINRGIAGRREAEAFLFSPVEAMHDPFLMKGMREAVERINDAIKSKERMLIYGDYDVDGVTSVALLTIALTRLGGVVETYIPHRVEEGYGLNVEAIQKAKNLGVTLIVTVDCGIGSFDEINEAKKLGIDVIITDHHEIVDDRVPDAFAVLNPLQKDCGYPFKHLAGVGVAFKLAEAVLGGMCDDAVSLLDLAGLGTVSDIVPMVGENRIIVKHGLSQINRRGHVGIKALVDVAGLGDKDISASHIGFMLGPRINAMGRIGSPEKALLLLLCDDTIRSRELAEVLDAENRNRQKVEAEILEEALRQVEKDINFKHHKIIILTSENWHPGVIGIVASRIVERYYRPTVLISLKGEKGKGSGRSIEGFHLFNCLASCKDLLVAFGGHEAACGLTIEKDKVEIFRDRMNAEAARILSEESLRPSLRIDMEIALSDLNESLIDEIASFAPYGPDNPRPVLASKKLTVKTRPRAIGKSGFKMIVADSKYMFEAVHFGRGNIPMPQQGDVVDVAYIPSINTWNGETSVQLELRDLR